MRFDNIDLQTLTPPDIIEEIDYEKLLNITYLKEIVSRAQAKGVDLSQAVKLEQSPTNIIAEVIAFAEMMVRQRGNQVARAVMLSSAQGADLDNLGALFGTARMAGIGNVGAELDDRYRKRIQLALEAFSTAGPYGAYIYHALKSSILVKDAAVYGPESGLCQPGEALNVILSEEGDGSPSQDLIDTVTAALNASEVRPLTDKVIIHGADITRYSIDATVYVGRGPDPTVVQQAAYDALDAYTTGRHAIGRIVAESGLKAAAFTGGAERVVLNNISSDIVPGPLGAAWCEGIEVTVEVIDGNT